MSFRSLQLAHSVLNAVQVALATGREVEVGIFGDFNGGLAQLAQTGREPSDHEMTALTALAEAITPAPQAESEAGGTSSEVPPEQVTASGAEQSAPATAQDEQLTEVHGDPVGHDALFDVQHDEDEQTAVDETDGA